MSKDIEPTLTDAQRAELQTWAEEYRTDADYPDGALITAVYDRWAWLEAERTRLVEENRRLYLEMERWQSFEATQAEVARMERDGE